MPLARKPQFDPRKWNRVFVAGDDKLAHGLASVAFGMGAFFLMERLAEGGLKKEFKLSTRGVLVLCALFALAVVVAVMYGKEVFDSAGNGYPDVWDAVCGILLFLLVGLPAIIFYSYGVTAAAHKKSRERPDSL